MGVSVGANFGPVRVSKSLHRRNRGGGDGGGCAGAVLVFLAVIAVGALVKVALYLAPLVAIVGGLVWFAKGMRSREETFGEYFGIPVALLGVGALILLLAL